MLRALCLATLMAMPVTALPAWAQGTEAQAVEASRLAQEDPALFALIDALGVYDILEIMSAEGVAYADTLEADMFPGRGGPAWSAMVARIYAVDRLVADFEANWPRDGLTEADVAALTAFFDSGAGRRLIEGEIAARRRIMDPDVEEAANAIYRDALAAGDPRLALLEAFIEANSLVDLNVAGALNSNFAFYRGLVEGGAFEEELPEELMLQEVWGQEAEIRADTVLWLYSYQMMAYSAASDADLEAYVALSRTPAGRALNRALFAAFDVMFEAVSFELGVAAAQFISGEET